MAFIEIPMEDAVVQRLRDVIPARAAPEANMPNVGYKITNSRGTLEINEIRVLLDFVPLQDSQGWSEINRQGTITCVIRSSNEVDAEKVANIIEPRIIQLEEYAVLNDRPAWWFEGLDPEDYLDNLIKTFSITSRRLQRGAKTGEDVVDGTFFDFSLTLNNLLD